MCTFGGVLEKGGTFMPTARNLRHRYKVEARLEQLQARRRENAKVNSGKGTNAESAQDTELCETKPTGSDDGLCKVPHGVGLAGQTSEDIATPQI